MGPVLAIENGNLDTGTVGRSFWFALIVAGGACLSPIFACATPFAALATLAALKLGRRDAFRALALVWLANQIIGYGLLGYPRSWDSAAWGVALGMSMGVAFLVASGLSITRPAPLAVSLPFTASFAAFELSLFASGLLLPVEGGAFDPLVVWHIFVTNLMVLCGFFAIGRACALIVRPADLERFGTGTAKV